VVSVPRVTQLVTPGLQLDGCASNGTQMAQDCHVLTRRDVSRGDATRQRTVYHPPVEQLAGAPKPRAERWERHSREKHFADVVL
jgi:hypothetical protein